MAEAQGIQTDDYQREFFSAIQALKERSHNIAIDIDRHIFRQAYRDNDARIDQELEMPDAEDMNEAIKQGAERRKAQEKQRQNQQKWDALEKRWDAENAAFRAGKISEPAQESRSPQHADYILCKSLLEDSINQVIKTDSQPGYDYSKPDGELIADLISGLKLAPKLKAVTTIIINNETINVPKHNEGTPSSWKALEEKLCDVLRVTPEKQTADTNTPTPRVLDIQHTEPDKKLNGRSC